jgi:hypothetical protein
MKTCLEVFETRILYRMYDPIKEQGMWSSKYNHELHKLCNELNTVRSRDSVVGIAIGYGFDDRGVGVQVPVG